MRRLRSVGEDHSVEILPRPPGALQFAVDVVLPFGAAHLFEVIKPNAGFGFF